MQEGGRDGCDTAEVRVVDRVMMDRGSWRTGEDLTLEDGGSDGKGRRI